jgi:hypothetical protein
MSSAPYAEATAVSKVTGLPFSYVVDGKVNAAVLRLVSPSPLPKNKTTKKLFRSSQEGEAFLDAVGSSDTAGTFIEEIPGVLVPIGGIKVTGKCDREWTIKVISRGEGEYHMWDDESAGVERSTARLRFVLDLLVSIEDPFSTPNNDDPNRVKKVAFAALGGVLPSQSSSSSSSSAASAAFASFFHNTGPAAASKSAIKPAAADRIAAIGALYERAIQAFTALKKAHEKSIK